MSMIGKRTSLKLYLRPETVTLLRGYAGVCECSTDETADEALQHFLMHTAKRRVQKMLDARVDRTLSRIQTQM